jgi:hypothetical protein
LVAMRARKPWVLARRTLLGWYVRFMIQEVRKQTENGPAGYVWGPAMSIHGRFRPGIGSV